MWREGGESSVLYLYSVFGPIRGPNSSYFLVLNNKKMTQSLFYPSVHHGSKQVASIFPLLGALNPMQQIFLENTGACLSDHLAHLTARKTERSHNEHLSQEISMICNQTEIDSTVK